jgi:predicted TIM-barrel fold metal-dependent hydrolase
MNVPLVDAHAHVFTTDMPLRDRPRHRPTYSFTIEQYLDVLDNHGVRMAVLAAASPWHDYNDYLIDSVARHPRLRGTVIVEPNVERIVLRDMADHGIVGIRLPFAGLERLPDITSFEYRRLFKRLVDLDWHVHLHVEGERLAPLLPPLEASGVKLVVDHLGRPDPKTGIDSEGFRATVRSVERGRTWVKTSAPNRLGEAAATRYVREFLRRVGPDKLIWGSDCPFVGEETKITYQQTIDWIVGCVDDAEARRKIMGENAISLYFS